MDRTDFIELLAECGSATATYFKEAEKTSALLGKCNQRPLTFDELFALLSQEILEREAFVAYVAAKRFLHSAALRGYEELSTT
jgi:hypothetical protein